MRRLWYRYWNAPHVAELLWLAGFERRLRLQRAQRAWSKWSRREEQERKADRW